MPSAKPSLSQTRRDEILALLSEPFEPGEVHWRVKARKGNRGLIFADARWKAYTERLDNIVGVAGWSITRDIKTLPGIPRLVNGRAIQSGKVMVSCVLNIEGLGTKSDTGEEWADRNEATSRASAQALKRTCAGFGLGEYLYHFEEIWVPLDMKGQPEMIPELPDWALPKSYRHAEQVATVIPIRGSQHPELKLIDRKLTERIASFRRFLGDSIYTEILTGVGDSQTASAILTAERQTSVLKCMERAALSVRRVHTLARRLGDCQLLAEMEGLDLRSSNEIASLDLLAQLVENLESAAHRRAA
jgi:hypothetical protein